MSDRSPFGWMVDPIASGDVIENPSEQTTIELVQELYKSGKGLRAIGRELSEAGISCRGGRWHHSTIRRVLDRGMASLGTR